MIFFNFCIKFYFQNNFNFKIEYLKANFLKTRIVDII